jgi:hypothetical protein
VERRRSGGTLVALVLLAAPARAQMNGENLLGDYGVQSGTLPDPGYYVAAQYNAYHTDTIRDAAGNRITIDPGRPVSMTQRGFAPTFIYVSPRQVLGANYGVTVSLTLLTQNVEAPFAGFAGHTNLGFGDSYFVPAQLGWHLERADAIASLGIYAPTGRYSPGGSDNLGLGMWSYELSGGGTMYLDPRKSLSFATTAFWELHSKKRGEVAIGPSTQRDVQVGQLLTLEGGIGKSILGDHGNLGVAYYAQWKLTPDDFGVNVVPPPVPALARHRVWGFGPEVTLPIATKTAMISSLNLRYLWETGARMKTEGQTLMITATFPVPSPKVAPRG